MIVTKRGVECGGRGSVLRATGLQGGLRLVSDQQRADERRCSVRRSRVVLTPRRRRQVCGRQVGPTGCGQVTYSANDGDKKARSPGRARRKPLKPLRAGTSGDSGVLVVTRVRSLPLQLHTRPRVHWASGVPHALFGRKITATPRALRAARTQSYPSSLRASVARMSEAISGTGFPNPLYPHVAALMRATC
jgi:hypothetical protein